METIDLYSFIQILITNKKINIRFRLILTLIQVNFYSFINRYKFNIFVLMSLFLHFPLLIIIIKIYYYNGTS